MDVLDGDSATWQQGPLPRLVTDIEDLHSVDIIGEEPDSHLHCYPRWIVFHSKNNFKKAAYATLTIHNRDPFRIAFSLKTKTPILCCFDSSGFLGADEQKTLKIYMMPSRKWERDVENVTEQCWKVMVQSVRVPENVLPFSQMIGIDMARKILRRTKNENPMVRAYTKVCVVFDGGKKPENCA